MPRQFLQNGALLKKVEQLLSVSLMASLLIGISLFWWGFLGSSDDALKSALGMVMIAIASALCLVFIRNRESTTGEAPH